MNKFCYFNSLPDLFKYEPDILKNNEIHMLIEDIGNDIFPYSQKNFLKLKYEDKVLEKMFLDGQLKFLRNLSKMLMSNSKIVVGINKSTELVPFSYSSLRYSFLKRSFYQKPPKDFKGNLKYGYFKKNEFFIFNTPKTIYRLLSNITKQLSFLEHEDLHYILELNRMGIPENIYKRQVVLRQKIYKSLGHSRLHSGDDTTEYYYLYGLLKKAIFIAIARDELISQMNKFLKIVCKKLNLKNNELVLSNLTSVEEFYKIQNMLEKNEISFSEVMKKIFPN